MTEEIVSKRHPSYGKLLPFVNQMAQHQGADCVEWPYSKTRGYGQIELNGRHFRAHRLICERAHGPCPTGKHHAAHSCGNKVCVNPSHLRWATRKENEADKIAHGRVPRWEKNGHAKLTSADVLYIRRQVGRKQKDLATEFRVSEATISMIRNQRIWKGAAP